MARKDTSGPQCVNGMGECPRECELQQLIDDLDIAYPDYDKGAFQKKLGEVCLRRRLNGRTRQPRRHP